METQCPKCGGSLRTIPAGTSKLGNQYPSFQVCDKENCDWKTPRQPKKTSGYVAQHTAKLSQVTQMQENKARLIGQAQDKKEEGIMKANAMNAAIKLVVEHPHYKNLATEEELLGAIKRIQVEFYSHLTQPFL